MAKDCINNRRLYAWALLIQEIFPEITYIPGSQMTVPDALSRMFPDPTSPPEKPAVTEMHIRTLTAATNALADAQKADPEISEWIKLKEMAKKSPNAKLNHSERRLTARLSTDMIGTLYFDKRIVVPKTNKLQLLCEYHDNPMAGHRGIQKMVTIMTKLFFWKGMHKDILNHVNSCTACSTRRTPYSNRGLTKPKLSQIEGAMYSPFAIVHMDIMGKLPTTERGNQYILAIVDKATRWIEAYAIPDMTAETIVAYTIHNFITRFGCPLRIVTDMGAQFCSTANSEVLRTLAIEQTFTTPYSPWVNGTVERANASITKMLSTLAHKHASSWDRYLQLAMFALRTNTSRTNNHTPYEMVFGHEARTPFMAHGANQLMMVTPQDIVDKNTSDTAKELTERMHEIWREAYEAEQLYRDDRTARTRGVADCIHESRNPRSRHSTQFKIGQKVLIYRPSTDRNTNPKLQHAMHGPFTITQTKGQFVLTVTGESGITTDVHIRNVQPFTERESITDAIPSAKQPLTIAPRLPHASTRVATDQGVRLSRPLPESTATAPIPIASVKTPRAPKQSTDTSAMELTTVAQVRSLRPPPESTATVPILVASGKNSIIPGQPSDKSVTELTPGTQVRLPRPPPESTATVPILVASGKNHKAPRQPPETSGMELTAVAQDLSTTVITRETDKPDTPNLVSRPVPQARKAESPVRKSKGKRIRPTHLDA
jgi:hypothetical protein